ncbi:universal stress protein [Nonomuraea sp. B19D2]|uniref:universal stress protein n=1 Tax=Nonomuraea sp. B19D2 TaxID=3159561 RepID=UPI0032DAD1AE
MGASDRQVPRGAVRNRQGRRRPARGGLRRIRPEPQRARVRWTASSGPPQVADGVRTYAAGLTRRDHASLLVAFVESLNSAALWFFAGSPIIPDAAADLSEELQDELKGAGVPWQFVSVRGDAARELETLASAYMADAIVVGRSHSTWHGSVAVGLAKRARHTVLIVP